jgi:hypothetical protein
MRAHDDHDIRAVRADTCGEITHRARGLGALARAMARDIGHYDRGVTHQDAARNRHV